MKKFKQKGDDEQKMMMKEGHLNSKYSMYEAGNIRFACDLVFGRVAYDVRRVVL